VRAFQSGAAQLPFAEFVHQCVLINVNKTYRTADLIDATRYAWKILAARAEQTDYVLAVLRGVIVGVFFADAWLPATPANFPGFPPANEGRYGFRGHEAPESVKRIYLHKRVPPLPKGAQNPIRYVGP
jgi:hypothetical protein